MKYTLGTAGLLAPHEPLSSLAVSAGATSRLERGNGRILVIVQLAGGNDGLNTIIPLNSSSYYNVRPTLAQKPEEALLLNTNTGMHRSMTSLWRLYGEGKVAVVQGAGYPDPSRSHVRSTEIWRTARLDSTGGTTWSDRCVASASESEGRRRSARKLNSDARFNDNMKLVAEQIRHGTDARIYEIVMPGFDTHANQAPVHSDLLKELSDGLAAFQSSVEAHGHAGNVLTLVFSEFGRSPGENEEQGTDHGTAGPVIVLGNSVRGGLYGPDSSLTNFDRGELNYSIDFRTIYATILELWLNADSRRVLGDTFDTIPFV